MTIQECYEKLGGDFAQAEQRMPSTSLIKRFITKFLDDDSYSNLCAAMEQGQREEAFRAAHTLKGVCANLSFNKLLDSSSRLTEELRPETDEIPDTAKGMMAEVERDYEATVEAIREFLAEE